MSIEISTFLGEAPLFLYYISTKTLFDEGLISLLIL